MRGAAAIILILALTAGCAELQLQPQEADTGDKTLEELIGLHRDYLRAIEELKLLSADLVAIALFETAFVRESMGADIHALPAEALEILGRYEAIAREAEGRELTDDEKGRIAGMRWRFLYKVGSWLVRYVGPEALSAFKALIK